MRVVLQRVNFGRVTVNNGVIGEIGPGLVLLVGLGEGDGEKTVQEMATKVANLRVFANESGRFDRSVLDTEGSVLAVPQFTLYADTSKGRRPEFFGALKPDLARPLFERFVEELRACGIKQVERGEFGAHMVVALENDGPVTISLEL
mgnify:CR=1 FL=1